MDLRTYKAKSLAEALRLVREDLGPDASVLHTREMSGGAWRWLVGGPEIEVTASSDVQAPALLPAQAEPLPRADLHDFRSQFRDHLRRDRRGPSASVEELTGGAPGDGEATFFDRIGRRLSEQHVDPDTVRQFIDSLYGSAHRRPRRYRDLCSQLMQHVAGRIAIGGPIQLLPATRRIVALVGPTGVGKTTTLAKLAAGFQAQGKRVGLITADTYRVAAVAQLRTYAEVLQLPMEVVAAGDDLDESIERLEATDLVLIDTAGCSPRDVGHIQELRELLQRSPVDETHLVLSAASSSDSMTLATEGFGALRPRTLMLTKIDEVARPGSLWPLLSDRRLPLSYITDGQNVPQDILPAERQRLAEFVVGDAIAEAAGQ